MRKRTRLRWAQFTAAAFACTVMTPFLMSEHYVAGAVIGQVCGIAAFRWLVHRPLL